MVSPVNASRLPSRVAAHHSGPERLAKPYSVEDSHLLFLASFAWRTPQRVICGPSLSYQFSGRCRMQSGTSARNSRSSNSGRQLLPIAVIQITEIAIPRRAQNGQERSLRKPHHAGRGCIKMVTWPGEPAATQRNWCLARPTSSRACVRPLGWRQAVLLTLTCVASGKDGRDLWSGESAVVDFYFVKQPIERFDGKTQCDGSCGTNRPTYRKAADFHTV